MADNYSWNLDGHKFDFSPADVREAAARIQDVAPSRFAKYFVKVDDKLYSVGQVLVAMALARGHRIRHVGVYRSARILKALGFEIMVAES